jgi:hypothetical protein
MLGCSGTLFLGFSMNFGLCAILARGPIDIFTKKGTCFGETLSLSRLAHFA